MNAQYGMKRSIVRPAHTMYVAALFAMVYNMDLDYVTKMQYNSEKDLVFVTRPNKFWGEQESIYEMHHLEQMVPAAVTAMKDMTAKDPTGILTVMDMAEKENLKFYKDEKYWNMDLREEFLSETRGLWEGNHSDKYQGRIFSSTGAKASAEFQSAFAKIDRELGQAVEKHGPMSLPSSHVEDFYDRIEK